VLAPDDGGGLRRRGRSTAGAAFARVVHRKAASGAGSTASWNQARPTATTQTAVAATEPLPAMRTEAGNQSLPSGRQNAPHRHGGYGTRGQPVRGAGGSAILRV
jgi:hypothetical protein